MKTISIEKEEKLLKDNVVDPTKHNAILAERKLNLNQLLKLHFSES